MRRIGIALLLLAAAAAAQDSLRDAYTQAKRMRGDKQKTYAAEQAARFAPSTKGADQLYLGYLWNYAGEFVKAADAFNAYLTEAGPGGRNRPTAMVERASALLEARQWSAVPAAANQYLTECPGQAHTGRMRFYIGRAQRALGQMDQALDSFRAGVAAGHDLSPYEVIDCLIQLGRYGDAKAELDKSTDDSPRFQTLRQAIGNLGRPLPKPLGIDFWAGEALGEAEMREKPILFSFWTTKVGNARDTIHDATNDFHARYRGKIYVIAPTSYLKFDPTTMRTEEDMTREGEQDFFLGWKDQYELDFPLVAMDDGRLHQMCGLDPAYPALPAFALSDKRGNLRYVRVGGGSWALEAVELMIQRLLNE